MKPDTRPRWLRAQLKWNPRWSLWVLLVALVVTLLGALVWLAGRYEASLVQSRLERDTAEITTDIRAGLNRNVQTLRALQAVERNAGEWRSQASEVLRQHREIIRIEWRDEALNVLNFDESPYRTPVFDRLGRDASRVDTLQACSTALRASGPGYSSSYFTLQNNGLGLELLDVCLPIVNKGLLRGYTVATYSLQDILSELVGKQLVRGQGLSFTEADGTRLAITGTTARSSRVYNAQQLLDLPGSMLVVRMDSWKGSPDFFPNVLTALVSLLALALMAVLFMLGRHASAFTR